MPILIAAVAAGFTIFGILWWGMVVSILLSEPIAKVKTKNGGVILSPTRFAYTAHKEAFSNLEVMKGGLVLFLPAWLFHFLPLHRSIKSAY